MSVPSHTTQLLQTAQLRTLDFIKWPEGKSRSHSVLDAWEFSGEGERAERRGSRNETEEKSPQEGGEFLDTSVSLRQGGRPSFPYPPPTFLRGEGLGLAVSAYQGVRAVGPERRGEAHVSDHEPGDPAVHHRVHAVSPLL